MFVLKKSMPVLYDFLTIIGCPDSSDGIRAVDIELAKSKLALRFFWIQESELESCYLSLTEVLEHVNALLLSSKPKVENLEQFHLLNEQLKALHLLTYQL